MRWQLIDEITSLEPGRSATAVKTFPAHEEFFQDHFPGRPIVPGVLQIEMVAQTGGKSLRAMEEARMPLLGTVKRAKFFSNILPGERCEIATTVTQLRKDYAIVEGTISVGGRKAAEIEVMYGYVPKPGVSEARAQGSTR